MRLRWGKNRVVSPSEPTSQEYHAIDLDKNDGNNVALCGGMLLSHAATELDVAFGESRKGKCKKCFKISRQRLQKEKSTQKPR